MVAGCGPCVSVAGELALARVGGAGDGKADLCAVLGEAKETIARAATAPKAKISFSPLLPIKDAGRTYLNVNLQIKDLPKQTNNDTAEVYYAITESGLSSNVVKGENSGRKLTHTAVARKLDFIGEIGSHDKTASFTRDLLIDKDWNLKSSKLVVFVQEKKSRRVLGAAAVKLSGSWKE